jgi:putative protease
LTKLSQASPLILLSSANSKTLHIEATQMGSCNGIILNEHQNYITGASQSHKQDFVGEAMKIENGWITVDVKNKFAVGDRLEFILPSGENREILLTEMRDQKGNPITLAPGNGHIVQIPSNDLNDNFVLISRFVS